MLFRSRLELALGGLDLGGVLQGRHRLGLCRGDLVLALGLVRLVVGGLEVRLAGSRQAGTQRIGIKGRSEEHTSELQSLMRISYAVFCLNKKITRTKINSSTCSSA